jgi:hypothetical protein
MWCVIKNCCSVWSAAGAAVVVAARFAEYTRLLHPCFCSCPRPVPEAQRLVWLVMCALIVCWGRGGVKGQDFSRVSPPGAVVRAPHKINASHVRACCYSCSVHSAQPVIGWGCAYTRDSEGVAMCCGLVHGCTGVHAGRRHTWADCVSTCTHPWATLELWLVLWGMMAHAHAHCATYIVPPACVSVDLPEEVTASDT